MDQDLWERPPSPPVPSVAPTADHDMSSLSISSSARDGPSRLPISSSLPTPGARLSRSSTPRPVQISVGQSGGILSPPTPAPSPNPRARSWCEAAGEINRNDDAELELNADDGELMADTRPSRKGKGRSVTDEDEPMGESPCDHQKRGSR